MRLSGRVAFAALLAVVVLLVGCGTTAPSPTTSPLRTPARTPAAATPEGVPSPTVAAGGRYAEAFVAAITAEDLTAHVSQAAELTALVGAAEQTLEVRLEADMAGSDMAFELVIDAGGGAVTQEMRIVGDMAYVLQDGAWASAPRATVDAALDGLVDNLRIVEDPAQLRYVGVETVDGRPLHRLTAIGTVPYAPGTGGSGRYDALDIWVRDDGTPVLVRGEFSATDAAGNSGTGSTEFRFSAFGEPMVIEAPVSP